MVLSRSDGINYGKKARPDADFPVWALRISEKQANCHAEICGIYWTGKLEDAGLY